ncbi:hypothetical protein B0T10DRAFT_551887 [Thelonectria olida]|uniref:Uncharacterized protein n=1 Tax=Thelonectria olida TaxID=1576542 RepID=A0A9P8VVN3_9HYPO|nr:hypothetical protein B0T10DRAFT_551887 [Thelonectria olida]
MTTVPRYMGSRLSTHVPIWPILGLRERLGKALGHDVVGPFNSYEMETWEKDAEKLEKNKRKREVRSDVLNGSFEDYSNDKPTPSAKKRYRKRGHLSWSYIFRSGPPETPGLSWVAMNLFFSRLFGLIASRPGLRKRTFIGHTG